MALRYYPLTRIITNRYTRGGEFLLPNGAPYTGRYYVTFDNKIFTGINPVLGTNIQLTPVQNRLALNTGTAFNNIGAGTANTNQAYTVAKTGTGQADFNNKLVQLVPYYPTPLDEDYARGYFVRYFAKNVSGPSYVFEISKLDWTKIQNGDVDDTVLGYETVDMLWQLTGPLKDKRVSQYQIIGGVFDTNKRVTEGKQKVFNGIKEFIGEDYVKFARITP